MDSINLCLWQFDECIERDVTTTVDTLGKTLQTDLYYILFESKGPPSIRGISIK